MTLSNGTVQEFHKVLKRAHRVVILTGAGVSAESGIPTFRGAGGLWRNHNPADLACPQAFVRNPALVWEFYQWRREVVSGCKPNPAHYALAAFQRKAQAEGKTVTLITQNVDRFHQAAGSRDVIELHGSLWDVCVATRQGMRAARHGVWEDRTQPLCEGLAGRGDPVENTALPPLDVSQLPHKDGMLLRPAVVWFGENLDARVLAAADEAVKNCELFITIGTSATVYPAAGFASVAAAGGAQVAEVNLEVTTNGEGAQYALQGKAGELLPGLLGVTDDTDFIAQVGNKS